MASKKKKKFYQQPKSTVSTPVQVQPRKEIKLTTTPFRFALLVTAGFFVIALLGMLSHEMWRDEHQAWLVARDANSLSQLLDNMNYEGNPALWHFFLYWITRVTHDPIYMQAFHLLIATSFIFIFNRYAPLNNLHKILFSFGYFPLYEYAVISRSYALGILLVFGICALYKNRMTRYILIGVLLALLANVTIYAVVIACCIAGILVLDYFLYQQKNGKAMMQLAIGMIIFVLGVALSLYQIWPDKDNSFPAPYATSIFDFPRWWQVFSKLFTTYTYIPQVDEHFWNTTIYFKDIGATATGHFSDWLRVHPDYLWFWVILPAIIFASGIIIFLRKPLILLLYIGTTIGLFSVYYYTALMHSRYCGYLLIALTVCYWLAEYYPEKKHNGFWASLGKRISKPFLTSVLLLNVIGAIVAYTMDIQYKFSPSKEVANYIKENKLDSLPIVGVTDFTISPLATYLDTKIFYPQMNDLGSFTIWSKKRNDKMSFKEAVASLGAFMDKGNQRVLWIKDSAPQVSTDGTNQQDMEKAILRNDLQVDLLKKFDPGIVGDERYFIYLVQKIDPAKVDFSKYIKIE
ncbi:MAG TPA: hypothetical protein VGQ04_06520 [Chitinophagaceae bacterium]|jgi:hypothetical protein|nr:hypothetical protein [Chitinophagaceae bacterium]